MPNSHISSPVRTSISLGRSSVEAALIGMGAGIIYGVCVATSAVGSDRNDSGFFNLALIVAILVALVGSILGAFFGLVFGAMAANGVRRLALIDTPIIAAIGVILFALAALGLGSVDSGLLVWTVGPWWLVSPPPSYTVVGCRCVPVCDR